MDTDIRRLSAAENACPVPDSLRTATGVYVAIHGHFYQPPRENPSLEAIERQPSAHPFHNWNERVHHECYRPNAFARVLDGAGRVVDIVNNFEYLSFNIGPTLMSWLEHYDPETYQRIIEADRRSCARLNGHGNAIAQTYNHVILPLADERDKRTQIRWGKADFRARFGRDPQGMWLAETAVDAATVAALIEEGIRFIILAPSQAARCRPLPSVDDPDPTWIEVGGGQIDPVRPYRCYGRDRRFLDVFFYDGPISHDLGFGDLLANSEYFAARLGQAVRNRPVQVLGVATDGETFGHHKSGAEKCLAYAFTRAFADRGWTVTNFAHYLSLSPPTWEVELKPVTAWSCAHGVERWRSDCGCGSEGTQQQHWRQPLRASLDWLRDRLGELFVEAGSQLLHDPRAARDAYARVIRDRAEETGLEFLARHQRQPLTPEERVEALSLLEMQRHAQLMYTSCGWFFAELSRPEGVQVLRYAARAIDLAEQVTGVQLEAEFVRRLSAAPSNVPEFRHGGEVYRQLVQPARVTPEQIAAQTAIASLLGTPLPPRAYCYTVAIEHYQRQQVGTRAIAVGHLELTSQITWQRASLMFAVLHLGGWDFSCCVEPFVSDRDYARRRHRVLAAFGHSSATPAILAIAREFGGRALGLESLFVEERHRIVQQLAEVTKARLDQLYTQVYRDNYNVLAAFHRDRLPVPQELQVAAEIAIAQQVATAVRALEQADSDSQPWASALSELEAIANEARNLRCAVEAPEARRLLERLVLRSLWKLLHDTPERSDLAELLERTISVASKLGLKLNLARAQELYHGWLKERFIPELLPAAEDESQFQALLWLGERLAVEVSCRLA